MAFAREAAGMGQLGQGRLRAIVDRGPNGLESPRPDQARDSAPVLQEPVEPGSRQAGRGRDRLGRQPPVPAAGGDAAVNRSEEHTPELQSLMRISSDVFYSNKKTTLIT